MSLPVGILNCLLHQQYHLHRKWLACPYHSALSISCPTPANYTTKGITLRTCFVRALCTYTTPLPLFVMSPPISNGKLCTYVTSGDFKNDSVIMKIFLVSSRRNVKQPTLISPQDNTPGPRLFEQRMKGWAYCINVIVIKGHP